MITAGLDIGSLSTKAVVLDGDDKILSWDIIRTGPDTNQTAHEIMDRTLKKAGLSIENIDHIVGTGYGRFKITFADKILTEISCHAKGAVWFFPGARTILDLGGQDAKAIRCSETGKVKEYVMNDKCAAGTGRYLERVAFAVEIPLNEVGDRSMNLVDEPANVNSYCAVFAQVDVIKMLRSGKHINDILAGACDAIVSRMIALLQRVGVEEKFIFTGGVAKNAGVVKRLEQKLGLKAYIPFDSQIVGALGAAVFARNIT